MSSNNTSALTFLLGAAIGVSAGLYLNSKNGKDMRKKLASKAGELESTIEEKVQKAYENLKTKVSSASESVKDAADTAKEMANKTQNKVNSY